MLKQVLSLHKQASHHPSYQQLSTAIYNDWKNASTQHATHQYHMISCHQNILCVNKYKFNVLITQPKTPLINNTGKPVDNSTID